MAAHDADLVQRCDNRLTSLEKRTGKMETGMAALAPTVERLDNEFFNHVGSEGLKTIVLRRFAADDQRHKSDKEFRELRDKETKEALLAHEKVIKNALDLENSKIARHGLAWTAAGVLVSAAAVCVAILAVVCSVYVIHHTKVEPLDLFHQIQSGQIEMALNYQDATNQPLYAGR